MHGRVERSLSEDHARLDALLDRAVADPGAIDLAAFGEFREGLLRHIAMEEKILLPLARAKRDGAALPVAQRLRDEHCAIATLLVPTPTHEIAAEIRRRLALHNPLEEGDDGVYSVVERLLDPDEVTALVERLDSFPAPPVAAYSDNARALGRVRDLLSD